MNRRPFILIMLVVAIAAALLPIVPANAQSTGNVNANAIRDALPYCPGLFNPTQFGITGSNTSYASWKGNGGSRVIGESSVGNWSATYSNTATAAQMDNYSRNTSNSWIDNCGSNNSPGNESANNFYKRRFAIKNACWDDLTYNHLYTVPTDPDTAFLRSIRLGNRCGDGQADKLVYQFKVLPQNALLVIYYTMSLENCTVTHSTNPEFCIEVQVGSPTASTTPSNLDTYTYSTVGSSMFYHQATPEGTVTDVSPFYFGVNASHVYNGSDGVYSKNIYLPWKKVVINLGQYLNRPVRLQLGCNDCSFAVHYSYSYFAGYCRAMKINVDGCPTDNASGTVATLYAPAGAEDSTYTTDPNYKAYRWYIATSDTLNADNISLTYADSTEWFNANFTPIPNQFQYRYNVTSSDFVLNGDTVGSRTFACQMTTYMNLDATGGIRSHPIVSRMFATANNQKPLALMDYTPYCDGHVELNNRSYCGMQGFMRDSLTIWRRYDNRNCLGSAIDTIVAKNWTINTPEPDTFWVKMHVPTDSSYCYSEKIYEVHSIASPDPVINASALDPCVGQTITLRDATDYKTTQGNVRQWTFMDGSTSASEMLDTAFNLWNDTVWLHTENGFADPSGHCSADTMVVIKAFSSPNLEITGDTIVCAGDRVEVTVNVADEGTYDYAWSTTLGGSSIQTGNTLTVTPAEDVDEVTYYVKVTRQPQGCQAWDSVTIHIVRPKLAIDPPDGHICPAETATLVGSQADHYMWTATPDDPSLTDPLDDTIQVHPTTTTTYTLTGYGSNGCAATGISSTVTVVPTPIEQMSYSPEYVDSDNPFVELVDLSQYRASTKWRFSDGQQAEGERVTHVFNPVPTDEVNIKMTTYNSVGDRDSSCYRSTSVTLPVKIFSLWMPNVFTPNEESNNRFRVFMSNEMEDFHIWIYNRQGQLVYESEDQNFEWDGTSGSVKCPQGAYVYHIKYHKFGADATLLKTGTVTLVW